MKTHLNNLKPQFAGLLILVLAISATPILAQKLDMEKLKELKPRSIGPAGMSGRVTAIDVVNSQPDIIYAGSASGGLWKSTSGGQNWVPIFDDERVLSIGAIEIDQTNPDVVWVGTGEGNPRNSLNGGYGVYKSIDAGKTWKSMGLEKTRNIHRIIVNPLNPNEVLVGAIGSPWGEHPERGVFKTSDGGQTWRKVLFANNKTGVADLIADPSNPNKIFAAMWEHRRKPWTFNSGGPGSGLHVSFDGGETWTKRTSDDGLPKGDLGRIGLAISKSDPNRVYAIVEAKKNGFYRSDDGGFKWKKTTENPAMGNRPFYYSEIYVDPSNENRIYSVFTYLNMSEDGGKTFSRWSDSYIPNGIHPDHHALWIHPDDPSYIIDGNDGGLNITRDGGKTWRFAENIPVGQFYHVNVDMEFPYNVYGGMQDNGSWVGPGYVWKSGGIRNSYWKEVMFGDGFDAMPDKDNTRYGFAMSQQGSLGYFDRVTGHTRYIQPTHPDADTRLRFNWNSALAQDPFDNSTIYFGSQYVHKSTNKGATWEIISPDLTTNDPEKQKQHESGGLTMDATGAENYTTILAIEPSPLDKNVIWAGTDDGNIQITRNGGTNWTKVSGAIAGVPSNGWVAQIRASAYNAGEAYVVINNYRNDDYKPYLIRTRDYGQTWESLVDSNDVFSYTLAVVQDPINPRLLFLGTDGGLYVSIDEGANWTKYTNGFPSVSTMDLVIHPREHDLVIGTFGRAMWVLDDIRPFREMATNGVSVLDQKLKVYPAPNAYMAFNQQASGTRFAGDAMFRGENKAQGAVITYSIKKEEPKKEVPAATSKKKKSKAKPEIKEKPEAKMKKPKADSVKMEVFNSAGELIRTRKSGAKNEGMNKITWFMDQKGVRGPSRGGRGGFGGRGGGGRGGGGRGEPGGVRALPGEYKIRLTYGDQMDSTMVTLTADPRVEINSGALKAQQDLTLEMNEMIDVAAKAVKQLIDSKKVAEEIGKILKTKKGDEYKALSDLTKSTVKSIDSLVSLFLGPVDKRQGITRSPEPTVMTYVGRVRRYLGSSLDAPGPTELRLVQHAKDKLKPAIEVVNEFFKTEWPAYKVEVDKIDLSQFKEYDPLELDY